MPPSRALDAAAMYRDLSPRPDLVPVAKHDDVEAAPELPRWARAALLGSLVVAAVLNPVLPAIMTATGRRGMEFIIVALVPLFALALRGGLGRWAHPVLRPMLVITAMLALSLFVGEFFTEGAVKVFTTLSGVAWAVVMLGEGRPLEVFARWGTALSLVVWVASMASSGALAPPSHLLALAALYARLLLEAEGGEREARPTDVLADLGLVAMVFLSTFRATTLAAAIALLAAARTSRRARWVLVLCALAAVPAVALSTSASTEPSYANVVARDDWQARYGGLGDDRLSGRADIWENVWRDMAGGPEWLLTGHGAGDVDFYVARVNPTYHAQRRGDTRAVHTHNTVLELVLSAGIATLIPLIWLAVLAARRMGLGGAQMGFTLGVIVVSMSNVPTLDWTGGTLLIAVWLAALARSGAREGAQGIDPGGRIQHGPAPRSPHDPPRTHPALPGREALS